MDIIGFPPVPPLELLPLRAQAAIRDRWLERRLQTLLPGLMDRAAIDMWILVAREYNEDPILRTMLPAEWLSARRRTILVLHRREDGVERVAVSRYPVGRAFGSVWNPESEPDQWARLAEVVRERDPKRIGVNLSKSFAHADGLVATERDLLERALPETYRGRLVSAEPLAVGWLESRIPEEMEIYPQLVRLGREIIHAGFTPEALAPGRTSTTDLVWWYRERIQSLGLTAWFQPTVELQRAEPPDPNRGFADKDVEETIRPGDLVHVDLGIVYLGLHTDIQQHAYVLLPGESEPPAGLREGMRLCNRVQDLVAREMRGGRSGNEVLAAVRAACRSEELGATIYSHPLGVHGHAAGATIGLWDQQGGVPGSGDYPVLPSTVWSIELNVRVPVPEWAGREVRIMLEEDAHFDGEELRFLDGRQRALALIRS